MDILDEIMKEVWRLFKEWIIMQWKSKCWIQLSIVIGMILSLGIGLLVIGKSEVEL